MDVVTLEQATMNVLILEALYRGITARGCRHRMRSINLPNPIVPHAPEWVLGPVRPVTGTEAVQKIGEFTFNQRVRHHP